MAFLRKWGGGGGNSNPAVLSPPSVEVTSKREWHSETPGERYFGLENFGNTCYANSVLQSLYFSKPFRELIEAYQPAHAPPPSSPSLSSTTSRTTSSRPSLIPPDRRPNTAGTGPLPPALGSGLGRKPSTKLGSSGGRLTMSNAFGGRQASASSAEDAASPPAEGAAPEGGAPLSTSSSFSGVGTPIISPSGTLGVDGPVPETTLLTTLHDLFVAISSQSKTTGTVAPQAFINQLKRDNEFFRSTLHQDAHEFLNYLVNMVAEAVEKEEKLKAAKAGIELPNPFGNDLPKTWVHRLFEGVLTNETRCLTCETVTSRDEAFLDLSIDIEPNSSVTACLRQFSASEMLCQRNKFSCDKCCGLQEAEKRMKIKKLPNILALHLKRFKYEESLQRHVKLTYRVVFPFELRLFNTADGVSNPDRLYELWAIVVHIGVGPHHGHYITVVKSGARWVVFDDNSVYPIEESDIQKFFGDTPGQGSGYVLFYQAVDLDLRGLGLQVPRARTETASSSVSTAPQIPQDEPVPSVPFLSAGLGLTLNDGAENVQLPTSPPVDAAHSFYPLIPEPSTLQPAVPTLAPPLAPSSLTTPTPSTQRSLPTPTPMSERAVLPSIPSNGGNLSPKKEEKEGGTWTLRGKKSMTSRIGRSLSLGPGKEAAARSASNPLPATAEASSSPPPFLSNGYTLTGDSSTSHSPLPPSDDALLSPTDALPPPRPLAEPTFSDSPLSTPIFLPPPSDDGSTSSLSTNHTGLPPPQHSPRRRGSRASMDLSSSGNALSNLFHRKTRPSTASSSGSPTPTLPPAPAQAAVGLGLSRLANGTLPVSSGVGSDLFAPGAALMSAQSTGPTRKEVERRTKEERKAREKGEERRVKERQRFVKEEARRVKDEAEQARKAEKVRRKMSVRMS